MSKEIAISELEHFSDDFQKKDWYLSKAISANYTFNDNDKIKTLFVTTSTNTITVTLPTAADNLDRVIEIVKVDSGSGKIIVDGEGAETILGAYVGLSATTADISQQTGWIRLKGNGTSFNIIGGCTPDKWHYVGAAGEPAFENSWVNYAGGFNNAAFRKLLNGDVQVRGLVKLGTMIANIFTFPVNYRPINSYIVIGVSYLTWADLRVVNTGGVIANTGSNGYISLENIRFNII